VGATHFSVPFATAIVAGWVLFGVAAGIGVLLGWLIWG
jgi:hypothetical protein